MPAEPVPLSSAQTALDSSLSSQSTSLPLWDRLTIWASENKTIVYTIAGVAVVITGAGVVYYASSPRDSREAVPDEKKRASKKERRKAKKEKEKGQDSQPQTGAKARDGEWPTDQFRCP